MINQDTRQHIFLKLISNSGLLTDFVKQNLNKDSFKYKFLATPQGPEREKLIYDAVIASGRPTELIPVTVETAGGAKITYMVLPDYSKVNGIRVTIAPSTAQKIANHFNMRLPTDKMSKQIYQAADTKIRATPLSGQGYTGADGQYYSGSEVAKTRIGKADAAIHYNQLTDAEIQKEEVKNKKSAKLIAGHGKDILQPTTNSNDVRMGGWHGADGKPLQPYTNAHKGGAAHHNEYGLYTRLVDNEVTVTMPDGRKITTTLEKLQNDPLMGKVISDTPGYKKYTTVQGK